MGVHHQANPTKKLNPITRIQRKATVGIGSVKAKELKDHQDFCYRGIGKSKTEVYLRLTLEIQELWKKIWSNREEYNTDAYWLESERRLEDVEEQNGMQ